MRRSLAEASRVGAATILLAALAACAMPSSGPPTASFVSRYGPGGLALPVLNVTPAVVAAQRLRPAMSLAARIGTGSARSDLRISRGDTVQISLWEAPPGSLFSSTIVGNQGVGSTSTANLPVQTVGGDGTIGVPYAGRIAVVGDTPASVERKIVQALEGKAVQPQALVNVQRSAVNAVTVTGEVSGGARVPLSSGGERVLDVIASAGGLRVPLNESVVQLSRGDTTGRALFETLVRHRAENVYVRPGDVVTVMREPRTFTALGATGRNAEIPFESSGITMSEAVAKAGGLADYRADASGVFLFRFEDPAVARQLVPTATPGTAAPLPVIYRFNLKDPTAIVAMSAFRIQPRDVIYISNAPGAELQKFMSLVQGFVYPSLSAASLAAGIR